MYEFTGVLESGKVALNSSWLEVLIYSMSGVKEWEKFIYYLYLIYKGGGELNLWVGSGIKKWIPSTEVDCFEIKTLLIDLAYHKRFCGRQQCVIKARKVSWTQAYKLFMYSYTLNLKNSQLLKVRCTGLTLQPSLQWRAGYLLTRLSQYLSSHRMICEELLMKQLPEMVAKWNVYWYKYSHPQTVVMSHFTG